MNNKIKQYRQRIDQLDERIVASLSERFSLVKEVARLKEVKQAEIYQPQREKQMQNRNHNFSKKYNLDEGFIQKLFDDIKTHSRNIQADYFSYLKKRSNVASFKEFKYREKKLDVHLPILEIYKRIYHEFDTVFFLESLGFDACFSRFSLVGFDPTFIVKAKNGTLFLNGEKISCAHAFDFLKKYIRKIPAPADGFCGGLVGYVSYEGARYFDDIVFQSPVSDFPDFEFGFYEDGLVFNKADSSLSYFYLREDRSRIIEQILRQKAHFDHFKVRLSSVYPSEKRFKEMVKEARNEIIAGNSFQIVLSRRYNLQIESGSPMFFYERLRELNPSPHMFYLKFSERELLGSSPELIMRSEKSVISNFPLAGTRGRGKTPAEDEQIARKLLADEKEKAEHLMLVDLGRNDLGRVSRFGSVNVEKLMQIKKYSHVQHIASEINGLIDEKFDIFDALKVSFPMGTVSGAPKIETMKIIDRLEGKSRGPYAGAVGYFSLNNSANFALMIRSLFKNGKEAFVQAGAGVVYDSNPAYELKETQRKAQGLLSALGIQKM